jgi:hypothetical protein
VTLWRYLWPRARTFDRERGQCQEKQQDELVSESRVQVLDLKGRQSQETQQDLPQSEPQEQGKVEENNGMESQGVSEQVRLKEFC